jgi:hypothetical protein
VTEEEIAQLLTQMEQLLAELGLDFIVAQERALAAEGVSESPTETSVARLDGGDFDGDYFDEGDEEPLYQNQVRAAPGQRSGGRPRFKRGDVVVTPLNPRARLAVLLDLVEVATAGTLAMERDVQDQLEALREVATERRNVELELTATRSPNHWTETWNGAVVFTDPPEAELRGRVLPAWKLGSPEARRASAFRARSVLSTLNALRAMAGIDRGAWLAPYDHGDESDWDLEGRQG